MFCSLVGANASAPTALPMNDVLDTVAANWQELL